MFYILKSVNQDHNDWSYVDLPQMKELSQFQKRWIDQNWEWIFFERFRKSDDGCTLGFSGSSITIFLFLVLYTQKKLETTIIQINLSIQMGTKTEEGLKQP